MKKKKVMESNKKNEEKKCERRESNPYAEALDPKSSVYANFTTLAYNASVQIQMPGPQFFSLKNRLHETYVVRIYQNPQIVSSAL